MIKTIILFNGQNYYIKIIVIFNLKVLLGYNGLINNFIHIINLK